MIVDHRNVAAAFRRLSLPIAISMIGDQLLGVVDTIAIGTLGAVQLAGATAASSAALVLLFALVGLWNGIGIIAAQRIGADDIGGFARTVRAGGAVSLAAGAVLATLVLAFGGAAMRAMIGGLPSEPAATTYLLLRSIALIPIAVTGTAITALGATGHRKFSIGILTLVNLVHIPLLLVLGLGWFTHHPLGIAGAGISTLISECAAAIASIVYLARRPVYRVFERFDVDRRLAWRCFVLGAPEMVFLTLLVLPDVFIIRLLAPLGALAIAGFRALSVVSDLTFIVPSPLQSAAQTVIGQRLGAADAEGARWFFARARRVATLLATALGALFAAFAWPLSWLFTLNAAVAAVAAGPLALQMLTLPLKGWSQVAIAPIKAAGDTRFSMFVGIVSSALVIPLVWIGIEIWHVGLFAVPIGWIVAWVARLLMTEIRLHGDDWSERPPLPA